MKIYILPVNKLLQPSQAKFLFPRHHTTDYSTEQDFFKFLLSNRRLITTNPKEADFHYLPVFWTRWIINHDWGQKDNELLQLYVEQSILDDAKTFTICHLSTGVPDIVGKTILFWASRRDSQNAIDIPLVCYPHPLPKQLPTKKYLASFKGDLRTHVLREKMAEYFKEVSDVNIGRPEQSDEHFVEKILESYITLCPRGVGASSFRFFETMQLGGVPCLISDFDTRPFKKYFQWEKYSLYAETPQAADQIMRSFSQNQLLTMGQECAKLWREELAFGKWCKYVLKTLRDL